MPNRTCPSPLRRRGLAAVGAVVALLAAAPAAADAARWIDGPRFDIGAPSTGTQVGVAPDGTAMAIWYAGKFGDTVVGRPLLMLQRVGFGGARGRTTVLDSFAARSVAGADLAVGAGGHGAVVWSPLAGSASTLQLTLIGADGAIRPAIEIATDAREVVPAVAVDEAGNALVAWSGLAQDGVSAVVKARRVTADGALGGVLVLGGNDITLGLDVAFAPDGTGWTTWAGGNASGVVRITPAGGLDGAAAMPSPMVSAALSTSSNGAALGGVAIVDDGATLVFTGARLPLTGDVIGPALEGPELIGAEFEAVSTRPALEPDGTVTLAWSDVDFTPPNGRYWASYARFAPGQTAAAPQRLPQLNGSIIEYLPVFAALPDGGALVSYLAFDASASARMALGRVASDGSFSFFDDHGSPVPALPRSSAGPVTVSADQVHQPFPLDGGSVLFATVDNASLQEDADTASAITTRVYDAAPPQLTATIPASGVTGSALAFSASAVDAHTGATVRWEFGDGSGADGATAVHAYANPGTYAVAVIATDGAGNVARTNRQLVISAPAGPPPTPEARRAAAKLKLTRVVRRGAKVTIAGTIARGATGRVTFAYRQRDGRSTTTVAGGARIAKGRFSATIRLGRALLKRFRLKPTVTAAYAGNRAIAAGRATRTVTVARAARRTTRRGRRGKR